MPTKILAIDDSKTMRLAIKITFAAEDAEVTAVSKGSEAIARAKQLAADLVIVDANLAAGEPSGYDVCQQLKADPETARIPVLLLVSGQTGVDAARLKSCGAAGFIAKPFETQELIDKVAEAIAGGRGEGVAASAPAVSAPPPAAAAAPPVVAPPPAAAPVATPPAPAAPPVAAAPPAAAAPRIAAPPVAAPQAVPATPAAPPSSRTVPLVGAPTPGARPPATSPAAAPPPSSPERSAPTAQGPARLQPAARPTSATPGPSADGPIPIAIPIPFAPASDPTPGMLARLRERSGAAAGLDPKVAEAIVALSRDVLEAIAWEVVPDLAEKIVRARADASAG
jgi:CheY-like chemotaxis protein